MLKSSSDAISNALNDIIPNLTIYVNNTPSDFERPSFSLNKVFHTKEDLTKYTYREQVNWQIVYFASELPSGEVDVFEQLEKEDALMEYFSSLHYLPVSDTDDLFEIVSIEGDRKDDEVAMQITLSYEYDKNTKETYDNMQEIQTKLSI
ncbi:phage tail terminator family protein [Paenibacillus spongiae]|uniref:Uncharacterized protein n=1 Tax=Paenibacillus spongiae TaxID=2909671 RepID=A0ABY5SDS7_9BACL|nr:hypothetical protein [Paenibacillus spongiae]UVI32086.1 hypothetical protein L1F29_09815 [Paenibacillus spongiae]